MADEAVHSNPPSGVTRPGSVPIAAAPAPGLRRLLARSSVRVAAAFLAVKAAAALLAFGLLGAPSDFLSKLSLDWDGIHYLNLARSGYVFGTIPDLGNPFSFAPLFPLLIRLAGAGDLAPLVVNNLAGLAAVVAVTELLGPRAGLSFALFPLWIAYSTVGYSEGTFVLAAALALLALRRTPAGVAGAGALTVAAALTRYIAGAVFALAGLWWLHGNRRSLLWYGGVVAAGGVGILLWHTLAGGSPTVYLESQKAWGASLAWPWEQWDWYLNGWFTNQEVVRRSAHPSLFLLRNALLSIPTVYGTALLWMHRDLRYLALPCTVIVAIAFCTVGTPAISTPRLLLSAFPALAVVGTRIHGRVAWVAYGAFGVLGGAWPLVQHLTSFFL